MAPPPVLLTRPRPASDALAAQLAGARVVVSPLIEIVPTGPLPELEGGLILTSPNGVAAYGALGGPPGLPVWCVGPRTAQVAADLGLDVLGMAATAEALAQIIPADAPPLTHLHGRHVRIDLPATLAARGIAARGAVIYDQLARPLTEEAQDAVAAGPVFAPLYSPRTARLLHAACPPGAEDHVTAICISDAVARATPFAVLAVAQTPDGEGMLRAIQAALAAIDG